MYKHDFLLLLVLIFVMNCCVLMYCSMSHNPFVAHFILSPIYACFTFTCSYSTSILYPLLAHQAQSSVLSWCLVYLIQHLHFGNIVFTSFLSFVFATHIGWIGHMNILSNISYVVQFFHLFFVICHFDLKTYYFVIVADCPCHQWC